MISLCGATRGRPSYFKEAIESALNTAAFPDRLEILVRVDNDDPSQYSGIPKQVQFYSGPRLGMGAAKPIALMAQRARGNLIAQFSDDQEYVTPGWDVFLEEAYEDRPLVLKVNEGREKLENPIVTNQWMEKVGYLYPMEFHHMYSDTFVETVATKAGILKSVPYVHIKHKKFIAGRDKVSEEARLMATEDFQTFVAMKEKMDELARKLAL